MKENKFESQDEHGNSCQLITDSQSLTFPFDAPEFGKLVQIHNDILWLRLSLPYKLDHINLYLLKDGDGWCLIDTGMGTNTSKRLWQSVIENELCNPTITKIVVTHMHPDHSGLAKWLQDKYQCPVLISRSEHSMMAYLFSISGISAPDYYLDYLLRAGMSSQYTSQVKAIRDDGFDRAVDGLPNNCHFITNDEVIKLGNYHWQVIISSGHSPGHVSLFCDQLNIFISGDQVIPKVPSVVSLYPKNPKFKDHRQQNPLGRWLQGLHKLRKLPDDIFVLPSHSKPFYGLKIRITEIIATHCDLLNKILTCLQEKKNVSEVLKPVYNRKVSGMTYVTFIGELLAHIQFLEQLNYIKRTELVDVDLFQTTKQVNASKIIEEFLNP